MKALEGEQPVPVLQVRGRRKSESGVCLFSGKKKQVNLVRTNEMYVLYKLHV